MSPSINPGVNTLLSTPDKEPAKALPALQPSWKTGAACVALSDWKAFLKIGGCLLCWKELQVPWSPWISPSLLLG